MEDFETTLDSFFRVMTVQLKETATWLGSTDHLKKLLDLQNTEFFPYAEKEIVSPKRIVIAKGDLHGDLHSLEAFL